MFLRFTLLVLSMLTIAAAEQSALQSLQPQAETSPVAQPAREGFGLAGVSRVAPHEAPVMAWEDRRVLTKQFGGCHRRASGKGSRGLFTHSDDDTCRRRDQRVEVGAIAGHRRGMV